MNHRGHRPNLVPTPRIRNELFDAWIASPIFGLLARHILTKCRSAYYVSNTTQSAEQLADFKIAERRASIA